MKTAKNFGILFILLTVIQILISNFCNFSEYLIISIMPVCIFCLPLSVGTIPAMFIAFASGLSIDWLTEGVIGLNAMSLVPVALSRKALIRTLLGENHIVRQEDITIRKNGLAKISLCIVFSLAVFLGIYIIADGAGTRPLGFNIIKFIVSLALGFVLSLIVANTLMAQEKK